MALSEGIPAFVAAIARLSETGQSACVQDRYGNREPCQTSSRRGAMFDDQTTDILNRITPHNLERIRASCEADGDSELAAIISETLARHRQSSEADGPAGRS